MSGPLFLNLGVFLGGSSHGHRGQLQKMRAGQRWVRFQQPLLFTVRNQIRYRNAMTTQHNAFFTSLQ